MKLKYSLLTIIDLKPGDHLCCIYNTEKEHRAILEPFLRIGLEKGEKVLYIVDDHSSNVILDYLRDGGIKVEPYLESGQLGILTAHEAYLQDGTFDPDRMINLLKNEEHYALSEGYSALRVTGEMSWALRGRPGSERLIEYEAKLNEFLPKSKCLAICQYDRRRFKSNLLLDVLCTHPIAVIGTDFYDNFYFIPPNKLLGRDRSKAKFRLWIRNLYARKIAEEALNSSYEHLQSLTNSMWDAVFSIKMPERVIEWANDSFRLIGYEPEEYIGKTTEFLYSDKSESVDFVNKLKNAIATGKNILHAEQLLKRKTGEIFPVEITTTIFRERGKAVRVTSIIRDITGRKQQEEEIVKLAKFPAENPNPVLRIAKNGTVLYSNKASSPLLETWGCKTGRPLSNGWHQFILKALSTKKPQQSEIECSKQIFSLTFAPVVDFDYVNVYALDITDRKQAEELQKLVIQVFEQLNRHSQETDKIREILILIKKFTGFEAVGIRLKKDEDFPYYETTGFPPHFIEAERYLCAYDQEGKMIRDSKGNPFLECMCGNILSRRINSSLPFFTEGGSFWTNSTSELLATTNEEDRQGRTRDRCHGESYESVALIPLRSGSEIIGLLQLNDSRKGMFSNEMISFFEGIGASIGITLARIQSEVALKKAKDELEDRVKERTEKLVGANENLRQEIEERKRAVDHQIRLEQQIRQMQKMEALGTLAGGIAHDLNNILTPIIVNTELALLDTVKRSPESQYLEQALAAANRGKDLVNQIITFSRQKEIKRKYEKIAPIIKEGLKLIKFALPTTIKIRENIKTDSAIALVNETQIHQVLINICSNAASAMQEKGGVLKVSLSEVDVDSDAAALLPDLKQGPYLNLTISDTGYGMEKAVLERIFDPFFTTKKSGMGTGMGLALVHGIIKSHRGAVRVRSRPGKGSTFSVFLPRQKVKLRKDTITKAPVPRGTERLLLVDDDKSVVQSMRQMLERLGYDVISKTSGKLALKAFRVQPDRFDLVITDMAMPNITGDKLAKELMRIRPDIPIILCTGFSEMITENSAKDLGISEFIMKPINTRYMAETIRRVLKGSS